MEAMVLEMTMEQDADVYIGNPKVRRQACGGPVNSNILACI